MINFVINESGWSFKRMEQIPWTIEKYGNHSILILKFKNSVVKEDIGNDLNKIKETTFWGSDYFILDVEKEYYYVICNLPKKFIKRIKKGKNIGIIIEDIHNNRTKFDYVFPCPQE